MLNIRNPFSKDVVEELDITIVNANDEDELQAFMNCLAWQVAIGNLDLEKATKVLEGERFSVPPDKASQLTVVEAVSFRGKFYDPTNVEKLPAAASINGKRIAMSVGAFNSYNEIKDRPAAAARFPEILDNLMEVYSKILEEGDTKKAAKRQGEKTQTTKTVTRPTNNPASSIVSEPESETKAAAKVTAKRPLIDRFPLPQPEIYMFLSRLTPDKLVEHLQLMQVEERKQLREAFHDECSEVWEYYEGFFNEYTSETTRIDTTLDELIPAVEVIDLSVKNPAKEPAEPAEPKITVHSRTDQPTPEEAAQKKREAYIERQMQCVDAMIKATDDSGNPERWKLLCDMYDALYDGETRRYKRLKKKLDQIDQQPPAPAAQQPQGSVSGAPDQASTQPPAPTSQPDDTAQPRITILDREEGEDQSQGYVLSECTLADIEQVLLLEGYDDLPPALYLRAKNGKVSIEDAKKILEMNGISGVL